MHNVVILGDVRTHIVTVQPYEEWDLPKPAGCKRPEQRKNSHIRGGVFLMARAVEAAIRSQTSKTRIYCPPNIDEKDGEYGELWQWDLAPVQLTEHPCPRPRLVRGSKLDRENIFPLSNMELCKVLSQPRGKFPKPADTKRRRNALADASIPFAQCPDVVVFDDLNVVLRQTEFDINSIEKRVSRDVLKTHATTSTPRTPEAVRDRELLTHTLNLLFERFNKIEEKTGTAGIPVIQPVILGSIKGNPEKIFSTPNTVWHTVLHKPWLRDRTVLLLDADDLRRSGLAISTGLSWERTAQDAITQMRQSKDFRPFLQFGQLVVRFGVTGALHIVRRSKTVWTYTLYFDHTHDDVTWTDYRNGTILGYTSVYIGCFVKSLIAVCRSYCGHPFMGALAETIGRAIPDSIVRCRHLCAAGYGKINWQDCVDLYAKDQWLPPSLFEKSLIPELAVSSATVPPVCLPNWSILSQSAQTRMPNVAQEIVLYGAECVLNQPVLEYSVIRAAIADNLAKHIAKKLKHPNLSLDEDETWKDILCETSHDVLANEAVFGKRSETQIARYVIHQFGLTPQKWMGLKTKGIGNNMRQNRIASHLLKKWEDQTVDPVSEIMVEGFPCDLPHDAVSAPLVRFGKSSQDTGIDPLLVVDRREVEGVRAIEKLIRQHRQNVADRKNIRPLSLAIFGPPGAGKSFVVKRINDSLSDNRTVVIESFNVAQYTGVDDLEGAFDQIVKHSSDDNIPLAFFDEFDCRFPINEEMLGWLKFFLAPMEDGHFRGKSIKNAILVFAGGTSQTFAEFSLANRSITDPQWIKFSQAKGPDFTSRLGGHLDIIGVNPANNEDELFLVRRAILIRSMLSQTHNLNIGEEAPVERQMLRSLLHVPEYRHGARSLRLLLELCTGNDGRISTSAVPPIQQLDMHVDGKAFLDLLTI